MFRHFPFLGDESWRAAEASECAAEQGRFPEYKESVYVNLSGSGQGAFSDDNLLAIANFVGLDVGQYNQCMSTNEYLEKVRTDRQAGDSLGVSSTPTLFINGELMSGLRSYSEYRVKIEQALAEAGY